MTACSIRASIGSAGCFLFHIPMFCLPCSAICFKEYRKIKKCGKITVCMYPALPAATRRARHTAGWRFEDALHKRPFHHAAYVESAAAYSVFAGHGRSVLAGNVFLQRRLQGAEAKDPRHGLSRCAVNDHNIRLLCVHNIHGVPQHEAVFSFPSVCCCR